VIRAPETAWVTISTRHPAVPAAVVVTGTGDNQEGHAAADLAGVPGMLGCPVRELAGEQTPGLQPKRSRAAVIS